MLSSVNRLPDPRGRAVVLDLETTGLDPFDDHPFLAALWMGGRGYACRWDKKFRAWMQECLLTANPLIFFHAKFDMHQSIQGGLDSGAFRGARIWDVMIGEQLLNEYRRSYSLDALSHEYFKEGKLRLPGDTPLHERPIEDVVPYAIRDVELTWRLYVRQLPQIELQGLMGIAILEMEVAKALVEMERRGAPVDLGRVDEARSRFKAVAEGAAREIKKLVKFDLNVRSGPQCRQAFERLNLPVPVNDHGKETFDRKALEKVRHPIAARILDQRSARTLTESFLDRMPEHRRADGRIHTNFHQLRDADFGTHTGRLSSSDPNLQQVPSPKRNNPVMATAVRRCFRAPKGYRWMTGDWMQFEFRFFAHYSQDQALLDEYRKNPMADFHQMVADLTGLKRNPTAKQINLGLVFGMGDGRLALELGLPAVRQEGPGGREFFTPGPEAAAIFNTYHSRLPGVKKILTQATRLAKSRGWVKTILGRRLRFPGGQFCHKAGGLIFQGGAADLMKKKMVEVNREFQRMHLGELILAVHDEYDLLVPEENCEKAKAAMVEIMQDCPELRVPILADVKWGQDWAEASG